MNRAMPPATGPEPDHLHGLEPGPAEEPISILLVDDQPQGLMALEAVLGDLGPELVQASSGREALRRLLERDFAVILLDIQMPDMDGYETAALLRQRKRSAHTPIIFLTASPEEEMQLLKGYQAGAVDYLFKPLNPVVLRSKVSVFIELARKDRALRRQAERLRESEALYRTLVERGPAVLYACEPGDGCPRTFVSPNVATLLGHPPEALLGPGPGWSSLLHPVDAPRVLEGLAQLPESGYHAGEYRLRHADGSYRWLHDGVALVRDEGGAVDRAVGFWIDITDQKLAEGRANQLLSAMENAVESICYVDASGRYRSVNQAFLQLSGHRGEELLGRPWTSTLAPEDRPRAEEALRAAAPGQRVRFEATGLRPDGSTTFQELTLIAGPGLGNGRPGGWHVFVRDITERKRAERQLAFLAEELTKRNRDLEAFATVASHDLQEPLRKVQLFADRLRDLVPPDVDPHAKDYLDRLQRATQHMQRLIQDVLTLSRISSAKDRMVQVALGALVAELVQDADLPGTPSLDLRIEGELPTVEADPAQLRQLLENLFSNARKYHRPGVPPQVVLSGGTLAGPMGPRAELRVRDNGIGIPEGSREAVFNLFHRLHSRQQYEGTGVGLAICRKIAERHHGSIRVETTEGSGCSFILDLPLQQPKGMTL